MTDPVTWLKTCESETAATTRASVAAVGLLCVLFALIVSTSLGAKHAYGVVESGRFHWAVPYVIGTLTGMFILAYINMLIKRTEVSDWLNGRPTGGQS